MRNHMPMVAAEQRMDELLRVILLPESSVAGRLIDVPFRVLILRLSREVGHADGRLQVRAA